MSDLYDKEGNRLSTEEWGKLHADLDYRVVGSAVIGPFHVSTVWLGMDHRFTADGPPIIFETLVFSEYRDGGEIDGQRYCTEDEAKLGHETFKATFKGIHAAMEELLKCPVIVG